MHNINELIIKKERSLHDERHVILSLVNEEYIYTKLNEFEESLDS